ncbi:MAG: thiosulfate oxidation carrier protein SoxY [Minwuia sp.]|nr:thiosulfate oxidation carrier protein SoxY [Minwuia sp.]
MTERTAGRRGISRRGVVTGALALLAFPVVPAWAEGIRNRVSMFRRTFPVQPDVADAEVLVKIVLRGREPVPDLIALDLPLLAENGDSIPLTFDIHCSFEGDDWPKTVHVFVLGNPFPEVARYHYGPWNGSALTEMRFRMRQTSDVVLVAEMADGRAAIARQNVEVLLGACGG